MGIDTNHGNRYEQEDETNQNEPDRFSRVLFSKDRWILVVSTIGSVHLSK